LTNLLSQPKNAPCMNIQTRAIFQNMGEKRNIYWGWYVVLGSFLISGINFGVRYCFGVFVKPMSLEYGWSRSVISLGASLMTLSYGIGGIFSGYLLDLMAPRWIMIGGAAVAAAGLILTSFIQSPWQYYLTYGLLCGLGSACFGLVVCSASVGKWFVRKRGIAIGIASIGIGIGTMILSPLMGYIARENWQGGFLLLGLIVLIGVITLAQLLMRKTNPEAYGLMPDGDFPAAETAQSPSLSESPLLLQQTPNQVPPQTLQAVFKDSRFWIIALCYSLAVMVEMSVFVHQVAYAIERNIGQIAAASSLGFIGVASILGRFFFGWFSDHIENTQYASAIGFFLMGIGMVILIKSDNVFTLSIFTLFFGFGYGSIAPMMPFLLAHCFGSQVLGTTYGVLTFFVAGVGGASGPLLCGFIYDRFGSYDYAWQINLAVLMLITFLILTLKPRDPVRSNYRDVSDSTSASS